MDEIIAYCGLLCSDCPAYVATQASDHAALERVAAEWREEFNAPNITVESVMCDGCLTDDGYKCGHCAECEIRACGQARGVANCAHCDEYDGPAACEKLQAFFSFVPDARTRLDAVRARLVA